MQLSLRAPLSLVEEQPFLSGLSALPPTHFTIFEVERQHDKDVAAAYFALRAAIRLIETCSSNSRSRSNSSGGGATAGQRHCEAAAAAAAAADGLAQYPQQQTKAPAAEAAASTAEAPASTAQLQEILIQSVRCLDRLLSDVQRPQYRLWLLLRLVSLLFSSTAATKKEQQQQHERDNQGSSSNSSSSSGSSSSSNSSSGSRSGGGAFVVPPAVLISLALLIR